MSSATFPDVQEGLHFLFEGSGQENTLAAGMLRVQFAVFDAVKVFHTKAVGGAVYDPYTDLDMRNWCAQGHAEAIPALIERLSDIDTMLWILGVAYSELSKYVQRPDKAHMAAAYSELSKYVQRPDKAHMTAAEHFLRYLRGTFHKSLRFSRDCPIFDNPLGWVDSDWAGDTDTRHSHVVYIIMMTSVSIFVGNFILKCMRP